MDGANDPAASHKNDQKFMMSAAHNDQNKIQQRRLALAKCVTDMARKMAKKMVANHNKPMASPKKITAKKGITLPTDMDAEHNAMAPAMEELSGKDFERKYMARCWQTTRKRSTL